MRWVVSKEDHFGGMLQAGVVSSNRTRMWSSGLHLETARDVGDAGFSSERNAGGGIMIRLHTLGDPA